MIGFATEKEAVLTELRKLHESATLQRVKDFLQREIDRITSESSKDISAFTPELLHVSNATAATVPSIVKQIATYGYDQDNDNYTIIVTENMESVRQESVSCEFTQTSFVLRVRFPGENGEAGTEHRLEVRNLFDVIDPTKSVARAGKKNVTVKLRKAQTGRKWDALTKVEHTIKEKSKPNYDRKKRDEDADDPNASLMKLMRDMYDQGDDQMKQTIAKAFYESRHKQSASSEVY